MSASTDKGLPPEVQSFFNHLHDPHHALFWVQMVPTVLLAAYMLQSYISALVHRPKFTKQDVVYQEYFASGGSLKNVLTKMGGASNCLRLVVTKDLLWVTSWFPFSLFAILYDLEHVIPLCSIQSIESKKTLGVQALVLSYKDAGGNNHAVRIKPKNTQAFLDALETSAARARTPIATVNVLPEEPVPTLSVAVQKYWLNLLAVGLFPSIAFVGTGVFHLPFPVFVPLFFASIFYGSWPSMTKKVPYGYQFVMGAVWLGGGIVGGTTASLVSLLLRSVHQ